MKKAISFIMCLSIVLSMAAQQQGIVRTLERPNKPCSGIAGVTIDVLEYPNAIVSKKDGKFSFVLKNKRQGDSFTISRVQKKGYTLVDKQMKGRRYAYSSSVPIEIVMVADQQLEEDKRRIEDKAYDKAKKNYDQKVLALENQLRQKTISEREYRQKYEQLNNDYNNYVQMIDQMAERYAMTDYKGMSDINQSIQACIEDADLESADSLINSKGDFDKREQELHDKQQLKEKSQHLAEQLQQDIDMELLDLKNDYSMKYYIHRSDYQNDSAAYYLERIVKLDTTDINMVYSTAAFFDHYLADYPKALRYYLSALDLVKSKYGEDDSDVGEICQDIGLLYDNYNQPDTALVWHHKALDILKKTTDPFSPLISMAYTLIGRAYLHKEDYDKGLEYTLTGLELRERAAVIDTAYLSQSYNNLGVLYLEINNPDKALEYHNKALALREQAFGEESSLAAFSHMNIGNLYQSLNDYDKALEHLYKAYQVYHKEYGIAFPETMFITSKLGKIHANQGDYDKAIDFLLENASGNKKYYGEESIETANSLNTLANVYMLKEDYPHAREYFQQVLDIYEKLPDSKEESIASLKQVIQELKDNP